ncbi:lantibiotic dehydratase C-terminal domain-containing protein [Streptomyces sp. TRM64462]|uniref:lantibiotic dehydratase C-terminal domain-containing protein n=1 Tax=Streptomyces sp. TRM64462 TaxID=2741726 RepID=UPI0015862AF0|nr:lantibiotic dehydratase C-terminal domain-containing protein [Streptomyces sp. TRM64462]
MTRNWLFCRLPGQAWADQDTAVAPRLPAAVVKALEAIRTDSSGTPWFFRPSVPGGGGTELWVGADDERLTRDVVAALLAEADRTGSRMFHRYERRAPACCDDLAQASSELALAFAAAGGLSVPDRLALAVLHLSHVASLVPEADRSAFLFLCWQHWAGRIAPDRRLDLGRQAAERGTELLIAASEAAMDGPTAEAWQRYLRALAAVGERAAGEGLPGNYVLFEQVHLTHQRLGVPHEAEALAALTVRNTPAGVPAATRPEPALQPA